MNEIKTKANTPLPPSVKTTQQTIYNIKISQRKCPRTKQHICKPHKPTHNQSLQKSCFLPNAPKPTTLENSLTNNLEK